MWNIVIGNTVYMVYQTIQDHLMVVIIQLVVLKNQATSNYIIFLNVTFFFINIVFRWYKFDDIRVYEIESSVICSSEAYILFYCRKN